MNLLHLAFRNIADNPFRSWVVAISAALVGGFIIGATLLVKGTEQSLNLVAERLGADITVIPSGNQIIVEQAFLMGIPANIWMPRSVIDRIAAIEGVKVVSPQLFLSTMRGASCCSVSDMFMIAYDPETDFTVHPWLEENLDRDLSLGEGIGGTYISVSKDQDVILVYGYEIDLVGNLEPTGSGLDQSLFFNYDTALEIARLSPMQAERALVISPDSISTALVRVEADADAQKVADEIVTTIPGVNAVTSSSLFSSQKERLTRLMQSITTLSILAWVISLVIIGIVTATAVSSRRHEIGVLRVLGASRLTINRSILLESVLLSLAGTVAGISIAIAALILFRNLFMNILEVSLLIPSPSSMVFLAVLVILLNLVSVAAASLIPILHISNQEPGTTIKEW